MKLSLLCMLESSYPGVAVKCVFMPCVRFSLQGLQMGAVFCYVKSVISVSVVYYKSLLLKMVLFLLVL